jgi:hypothetical protein
MEHSNIRKRFYDAFIESVKSALTGAYSILDAEFHDYIREQNPIPMEEDEDAVEAFSELRLDLSAPDFNSALEKGIRAHISRLLNISGQPSLLATSLVTKIVSDTKTRLSDSGPDLWKLWTDTTAGRATASQAAAEFQRAQNAAQEAAMARLRVAPAQDHEENRFIEDQKEEMDTRRPVINFPPETLDTYYKSVLGDDYLAKEVFDTIIQTEVKIGEYLQGDPDNIIFQVAEGMEFTSSRSQIQKVLPLYECTDSMSSFSENVYISLTDMGCPCIGVANYDALKMLIRSNYQIFQLRNTKRKTGTLVRYSKGYTHCQSGSEMDYYATFIPSHSV